MRNVDGIQERKRITYLYGNISQGSLGFLRPHCVNHRHHTVKLLSKQMLTSAGAILHQTMCFRCCVNTPLFGFMTCKAHKVTGEKDKASAFQTEVSASPHSPLPLISNTVDGAHDVRENHLPIHDQKKHNKVDEQGNAIKKGSGGRS